MKPKKQFSDAYRTLLTVNFFINAVFCALCPPILFALGSRWLCNRFGWNRIVIALAVLFGVAVGMKSMIGYIKKTEFFMKHSDDSQNKS